MVHQDGCDGVVSGLLMSKGGLELPFANTSNKNKEDGIIIINEDEDEAYKIDAEDKDKRKRKMH